MVIAALVKDAKRFKSKWELHTGETIRSKPNVVFLKRTLSNVVKVNHDLMRKPHNVESMHSTLNEKIKEKEIEKSPKNGRKSPSRVPKKSRECSKSKYQTAKNKSKSMNSSQQKRKKV